MGKDDWVEVTLRYQRWVIDVIDAVAIHKKVGRSDVLRAIAMSYGADKLKEHDVIHKVAVRNELTGDRSGVERSNEDWGDTIPLDAVRDDRPPTIEIEKRSRPKKR